MYYMSDNIYILYVCVCPQADTCAEREGNAIAHHGRDYGTHAGLHG